MPRNKKSAEGKSVYFAMDEEGETCLGPFKTVEQAKAKAEDVFDLDFATVVIVKATYLYRSQAKPHWVAC